jgi:hypothetical protein
MFSPDSGAWSLLGGLFRNELVRQYYAMDEAAQRELNHGMLWGGSAGPVWHEAMRKRFADPERFRNEYLPRRASLVRLLEAALEKSPGRFPAICEIGTGNGLFIDYLSKTLRGVERFVGCDINSEQIRRNRDIYRDSKVEFVDNLDDVLDSFSTGVILVSVGTFEYFTRPELEGFLARLRAKFDGRVAIGLSEPINMDLDSETESKPRGWTMFSHNYRHILRSGGYSIDDEEIASVDPSVPFYNNVTLFATPPARAA